MPDTDQQPLTALPAPRRVSRKVAFLVITAVCALVAVGIVVVPLLSDDSSGDGVAVDRRAAGVACAPAPFPTSPSRTPRAAGAPTLSSQPSPTARSR